MIYQIRLVKGENSYIIFENNVTILEEILIKHFLIRGLIYLLLL